MSIRGLMIHTCDIQYIDDSSVGYEGGEADKPSTIATGMPCRVTTDRGPFGELYRRVTDQYSHQVYFADNPGITNSQYAIIWTSPDSIVHTLSVQHIANPDGLNWFWVAYCMENN